MDLGSDLGSDFGLGLIMFRVRFKSKVVNAVKLQGSENGNSMIMP